MTSYARVQTQVRKRPPRPRAGTTRFRLLHEIFEAQADARPGHVAIESSFEAATCAELERRANRLARCLLSRDVVRAARVAVLLPRGVDAVAAMLAILKAGATCVPIDPAWSVDRIAYVLEDSGASALATDAEGGERFAAFGGEILRVDADNAVIERQSPARPARTGRPRDLCCIIYPSVCIGRPRGVMIDHRSACRLVRAEGRLYRAGAEARLMPYLSPHFLIGPHFKFSAMVDQSSPGKLARPTCFFIPLATEGTS